MCIVTMTYSLLEVGWERVCEANEKIGSIVERKKFKTSNV
jgi:hypothetical protein